MKTSPTRTTFQYLMVQLKDKSTTESQVPFAISIPHGTIKS